VDKESEGEKRRGALAIANMCDMVNMLFTT
jgi:hypothetical protein